METNAACPCPKAKCDRHGQCAACREYHTKKGTSPYCERGGRAQNRANRKKEGKKGV